jgi:hypothetical protein
MRAPLLALMATLLLAVPAHADVTASTITTPADPTFPLDDETSGHVTVSGTATHNDMGDQVDIVCTYVRDDGNPDYSQPATGVAVDDTDGSFSASVPLQPLTQYACRLRAIPSGSIPSDLTPFNGPRIGVGERHLNAITGGWSNYSLGINSMSGMAVLEDPSDCGVEALSALDPVTLRHAQVFSCGDALEALNLGPPYTRSEVRVDGKDAFFTHEFNDLGDMSYPLDPLPTINYDTSNGLGSVSSQQTLAFCTPGGFPPSAGNCSGFAPSGVRVDHAGAPLGSGHLITTSETFVSTDGQAHDLDLLYENSSGQTVVTWRFPGESAYADHVAGDVLSAFPPGVGATLLNQLGGQSVGVFTWSGPPADVRFAESGDFETHYVLHVTPDCPGTIKFAWGYAFTQNEVDALTPGALSAVTLPAASCPTSPGQGNPPPAGGGGTKLRAKFGRVKIGGDGTVTVLVNVPDAGSVSGLETAVVPRSAKKKRTKKLVVSRARKSASVAGQVKLVLKLNKKGKRIFRLKHKLPVTLAVTYKPSAGSGNKLSKHLTLKLKKPRRHKH